MSDAIERFTVEYQRFHRISRGRAHEQVAVLRELEQLGGGDIFNDPGELLVRFQLLRLERGNVPATIGRLRGMIRPFYEWAWQSRFITAETLMEVKAVRGPRGYRPRYVPRPYRRDEIERLWRDFNRQFPADYPDRLKRRKVRWVNGTTPWRTIKPTAQRLQTRAIIVLALCGGLRRDEIYRLTLVNMHHENEYVVVDGARKNGEAVSRAREVPWVTAEMRDWVREWIEFREFLNPAHDRPWMSLWGKDSWWGPLYANRYEATLAKLGRGYEFHRLRHTAATEMLRAGYPLESVQRILGHATIQQTLVYAELLPDDLVRIAARSQLAMSDALIPESEPEAA